MRLLCAASDPAPGFCLQVEPLHELSSLERHTARTPRPRPGRPDRDAKGERERLGERGGRSPHRAGASAAEMPPPPPRAVFVRAVLSDSVCLTCAGNNVRHSGPLRRL